MPHSPEHLRKLQEEDKRSKTCKAKEAIMKKIDDDLVRAYRKIPIYVITHFRHDEATEEILEEICQEIQGIYSDLGWKIVAEHGVHELMFLRVRIGEPEGWF